jgi:hypothetical protein
LNNNGYGIINCIGEMRSRFTRSPVVRQTGIGKMNWLEIFFKIDAIAIIAVLVSLLIAWRQEKQLKLLEQNLEQLKKDRERRDRIEKFFRAGKSRKYMLLYPSYFHGKPVDTVWAGDFFALITLNNALSAVIPEKTFELKPVSPHEKYGEDAIPDRDLILVCSPRANSMLSAVFPTPCVHSDEDKNRLSLAQVVNDLPCWFVEDYTYSDLALSAMKELNTTRTRLTTHAGAMEASLADAPDAAVGDAINAANVPRGTTIGALADKKITLLLLPNAHPNEITDAKEMEASLTKPILKIWDLKGAPHDSLVSPAEEAYLQATRAYREGRKTFIPNPGIQQDYGILLRTRRANGRYTFVIAGIHQYGTFIAAKYLHDLFDPDKKPEDRIPTEDDFVIVVEGQFSHEHFHVIGNPYPVKNGAWIWTRRGGGEWEKLER